MKSRTLKIEEDGDFWKGTIRPKIRLKGSWLENAGFKPGSHVSVTFLAHGVIELRSQDDPLLMSETSRQISLPGKDFC
jgi:hypothetical protein